MPRPIALCVEDLLGSGHGRYVRCVADIGRRHAVGLGLDTRGEVVWRSKDDLACELFATADDRLALIRPEGAPSVWVHRAGRSLEAPHGKPVILLDQDELEVGGRRLRLHVHGFTASVRAPAPLGSAPIRRAAAIAATAMALGASLVACKRSGDDSDGPPIDVREQPPKIAGNPGPPVSDAGLDAIGNGALEEGDAGADGSDGSDAGGDAARDGAVDASGAKRGGGPRTTPVKPPKIDVRDLPPYVE